MTRDNSPEETPTEECHFCTFPLLLLGFIRLLLTHCLLFLTLQLYLFFWNEIILTIRVHLQYENCCICHNTPYSPKVTIIHKLMSTYLLISEFVSKNSMWVWLIRYEQWKYLNLFQQNGRRCCASVWFWIKMHLHWRGNAKSCTQQEKLLELHLFFWISLLHSLVSQWQIWMMVFFMVNIKDHGI